MDPSIDLETYLPYDRIERIRIKIRNRETISYPESGVISNFASLKVNALESDFLTDRTSPVPEFLLEQPDSELLKTDFTLQEFDAAVIEHDNTCTSTEPDAIRIPPDITLQESDPTVIEHDVTRTEPQAMFSLHCATHEAPSGPVVGGIEPGEIEEDIEIQPEEALLEVASNSTEPNSTEAINDVISLKDDVTSLMKNVTSIEDNILNVMSNDAIRDSGVLLPQQYLSPTDSDNPEDICKISDRNVEHPKMPSGHWVTFDESPANESHWEDNMTRHRRAQSKESNSAEGLARDVTQSAVQRRESDHKSHNGEQIMLLETLADLSLTETPMRNSNGGKKKEGFDHTIQSCHKQPSGGHSDRVAPSGIVVTQPCGGADVMGCAGRFSSGHPEGLTGLETERSQNISERTPRDSDVLLPKESHWSTGLCQCQYDCGRVCYADVCLPCAIHQLASTMEQAGTQRSLFCIKCYLGDLRTRLRHELDIRGSEDNDCCVSYWCSACVIAQMEREIRIRGRF